MMKFYVVWRGKEVGIFHFWDEVQPLVTGFSGAKYKAFPNKEAAKEALSLGREPYYKIQTKDSLWKSGALLFDKHALAVDAACSGNPGVLEYRGIDLETLEELFHQRFDLGTNNVGEFLAIVDGMRYLQTKRKKKAIYSDSKIALSWVRQGKCRSTLRVVQPKLAVWKAVDEAEAWLKRYGVPFTLLKWKTEDLGEIPADFGRK